MDKSQVSLVEKIELSKIKNKQESLVDYGETFQNNILRLFIIEPMFFSKVKDSLTEEYFSKYQSEIIKIFKIYFEKYTKLPAQDIINVIIKEKLITETDKKHLLDLTSEIYNILSKINDNDYYKDKLKKFLRNSKVKNVLFDSLDKIAREDYDEIVKDISDAVKDIDEDKILGNNYLDMFELREHISKREFILF